MNIVRMRLSYPSISLLQPVDVEIAMPGPLTKAAKPYRAVWLLHCALEGGNFFFESLNAGEVAEKYGLALIAPTLGNGYFMNRPQTRLADALQEIKKSLPELLPLSPERKDNAVLGISMGAFGALRWALESGDFGAAVCISGVFDCSIPPDPRIKSQKALRVLHQALEKNMRHCLLDAEGRPRPEADFNKLAASFSGEKPDLFFYCGDEDYLSLPQTRAIHERMEEAGFRGQLAMESGGHDSSCWRAALRKAAAELFKTSA